MLRPTFRPLIFRDIVFFRHTAYICRHLARVVSSVGLEHYLDRVGATGSNPVQPTNQQKARGVASGLLFLQGPSSLLEGPEAKTSNLLAVRPISLLLVCKELPSWITAVAMNSQLP